ncbi:nuclear transport factor 2 family protein [Aquibium sp. ELW1220]|uniref:nuclear transport factor 2 family protein n=1 Tax=Aquibium sp. ELW1220 TaxID=2976766 RepID=UPI0025B14819|nr:nuclear transport factor 2 family protein [Aquibium sp. ELW1220]MDN2580258.1 nuclear transport factor 2 family protein [Aquibium sp. ELW1220]
MNIEFPRPIAAYFEADRSRDADAVAACFGDTGVVKDERRTHAGREAIRRWKAQASTAYSYTVEPFALSQDDGRMVVTGRIAGNFPGSPVDLRYVFTLDGDRIAALEIVP